mmetsp:Transcript_41935/g.48550  ORF Transcript_41935/g.48550 Transcript_41935/m.48550 type:complete len:96 (-) Transcript_41935:418-705(-)
MGVTKDLGNEKKMLFDDGWFKLIEIKLKAVSKNIKNFDKLNNNNNEEMKDTDYNQFVDQQYYELIGLYQKTEIAGVQDLPDAISGNKRLVKFLGQ